MRQRQVADAVGIPEGTYANAESSNVKKLRLDRVLTIARFYDLSEEDGNALIAAWEALPESQYNKNNAKPWAERDARRAKIKNFNKVKLALLEVTALLVTSTPDPDTLCACDKGPPELFGPAPDSPPDSPCEICNALQLLGLSGWTSQQDVIAKLARIQEGMGG